MECRRCKTRSGWAAVVLLAASFARAQGAPGWAGAPHGEAWAAGGFEQTWLLGLGGGATLAGGRVRLDGQVATPLVSPFRGGRVAAGASVRLVEHRWLGVVLRGEVGMPWSVDGVGTWLGLDSALAVQPGLYRERWLLALDVGARWGWFTAFTPSAAVEQLFGDRPGSSVQRPGAGLLAFPSHRFHLGLTARGQVVRWEALALEVFLRGGVVWLPTGLDVAGGPPTSALPFEAVAGVSCVF